MIAPSKPLFFHHRHYRYLLAFQQQSSQLRIRESATRNSGNAMLCDASRGFCDQTKGNARSRKDRSWAIEKTSYKRCASLSPAAVIRHWLQWLWLCTTVLTRNSRKRKEREAYHSFVSRRENVYQSLSMLLSSFGDPSLVAMVRSWILVLKEGFPERKERKATQRADLDEVAFTTYRFRAWSSRTRGDSCVVTWGSGHSVSPCGHASQVLVIERVTALVLQPSSYSQRRSRVVQHNNTPNTHNNPPWMRTKRIWDTSNRWTREHLC